jgi:putative membrane protein
MFASLPRPRFLVILAILFGLEVIWSGIAPSFRQDWILENILVLLGVTFLAVTGRWLPLSRLSYLLIFVFLALHELGAHWTYSNVPYDEWWQAMFGVTLNAQLGFTRNHFDRLVHFSYGFLLAYPIREMFLRVADARGFWGYFLPLDLTMSTSMLYELVEWATAVTFGGELGAAYLGTQGDEWDAHKDMALASLGALLAMLIVAAINARYKRDFAHDLADSLRVKSAAPLGEDELRRMRAGR